MSGRGRRWAAFVLAGVVLLAVAPGTVAARTDVGLTVVVERGDTVEEDLTVAASTVLIDGTVEGDLTALAGNVIVTGTVTGDVTVFGGRVQVVGEVGGDVDGFVLTSQLDGDVARNVEGFVGTLDLAGRVRGDVDVVGLAVTVQPGGVVDGRLETTAVQTVVEGPESTENGAERTDGPERGERRLAGQPDLRLPPVSLRSQGVSPPEPRTGLLQALPGRRTGLEVSLFDAYGFLVNLLLGGLLVGFLPRTARQVAATITGRPLQSVGTGVLVLVAVPVVLLLVGLSLFGLPLALVGFAVWIATGWVGTALGRFAVGLGLLLAASRGLAAAGIDWGPVQNRWVGLVVGYLAVAVAIRIPYLGLVVDAVVLALGLGGLARLAYRAYGRTERAPDRSVESA